jgi:post-GPI attachment to proteins factor 3
MVANEAVRALRDEKHQPIKYYGKWPFRRVAGMQEFFSVLFSLGNLVAHAHNLVRRLGAFSGSL